MGKYIRKILAACLVAALAATLACPAFALSKPKTTNFGDWTSRGGGFRGEFGSVTGYVAGKICPSSHDSYHQGSKRAGFGNDDVGNYTMYECEYCGKEFKVYSSFNPDHSGGFGSDFEQSYDDHVADLPATGYTSAGYLIWQPTAADVTPSAFQEPFSSGQNLSVLNNIPFNFSFNVRGDFLSNGKGILTTGGPASSSCYLFVGFELYFSVPLSGSFRRTASPQSLTNVVLSTGRLAPVKSSYSEGSFSHFSNESKIEDFSLFQVTSKPDIVSSFSSEWYFPVYEVIPDTAISGDTYNITSRPTSITGDYGIIGDDGEITQIEGNTIVNETNSTVYNPVTGDTNTMTDWQYDYSTRTYTVTLDNGKTQTITYGDENVTILEGGTTYNVYYLVDGSGTGEPDPGPGTEVCDHTWTETSRTEPTCTMSGREFSTCSKCSQTKTEILPALGHNWQVKQTVNTQYDDSGQLVQQGYTIFECSVCHEQYKDMDSAGPPEGDHNFLDTLGQIITEKLEAVLHSITAIFTTVPSFFDGFLDFLAAMFPFLPPEIMALLTFGIAAVVFIGIIKAIRR